MFLIIKGRATTVTVWGLWTNFSFKEEKKFLLLMPEISLCIEGNAAVKKQ